MKILFVVHGYKPAFKLGGPIISVSTLAERLVIKGHQVVVFTTNSNQTEILDIKTDCPHQINGVEVWYFRIKNLIRFPFNLIPYFSKTIGYLYTPELKKNLDKILPEMDIIHTHMPFIYPTLAAARANKKYKKPFFYHQRGVLDPNRLNFRSLKKYLYITLFEKSIIKKATTLIALTQNEILSYQKIVNINKKIKVIPNGIDINLYRTIAIEKTPLGIPIDKFVILFLGRLHPIKGADKLIDAFIKVYKQFPKSILVMAGPDEFNIESSFKKIVEKAGLSNSILFPGMLSGEIKKDILARSNIFALPSEGEGFSIAILEALASQTPVVISPECNFPEVADAKCGLIIENDSEKIATSLINLIKNPKVLDEMSKNARNFVGINYSWDYVSDKIIEAYQDDISKMDSK